MEYGVICITRKYAQCRLLVDLIKENVACICQKKYFLVLYTGSQKMLHPVSGIYFSLSLFYAWRKYLFYTWRK